MFLNFYFTFVVKIVQMKKTMFAAVLLFGSQLFANNISLHLGSVCISNTITNGIVKGKVITTSGDPVEGALVYLNGIELYTKADGSYEFSNIPTGIQTIKVLYQNQNNTVQIEVSSEVTFVDDIVLHDLEDTNLEEIVINASKLFAQKKSETVARLPLKNLENPQVYTVVPKELLQEQVAFDFKGALLSSPGVTNVTLGVGSGGTGLAMMMRGFTGADGAGSIRNGMATNFVSLSDPVNLEQLEIIKGPSSTLFGSTLVSYGGLVNRTTKQAFDGEKTEVGVTAGGYNMGRFTIDYNTPLDTKKQTFFRLNAAFQNEKSFQDQGINRTFMVAPTFKFIANDRLTFNLDMEYFNTNRNSTYVGLTPTANIKNFDELNWDFKKSYASNDITSKANVMNVFASANYKLNEYWTSDTRFSYSNTENNANYLFLLVKAGSGAQEGQRVLQRRLMNLPSNFNTMQLQQNFVGAHTFGKFKNKVLFGVDFTQLRTTDSRTTVDDYDGFATTHLNATTPFVTVLNGTAPVLNYNTYEYALSLQKRSANRRDTQTFSAYVSDVISYNDRLHAMISLRGDRFHDVANDYMQTSFSPKLGLVYQVIKDQLSVFGNYMNGFKNVAPSLLSDNTKQVFKPEQANQVEYGVKFELLQGKINGTVSVYDIQVKDKVRTVLDANNIANSVQDGTQNSKGIEFDIIANPFPGFHVIMGYGYNDSSFEKSSMNVNGTSIEGKRPAGVPRNSANYWLSYKFSEGSLNGFGLGFGGNYSDDYYFNDQNTVKVSGFHTMDATVFFEKNNYRLGLKVNNISDKNYFTALAWATPQQGRTIFANLIYKF